MSEKKDKTFEYTPKLNEEKPLDHLPVDSQQLVKNATTLMEIFKEEEESVFLLDGSWGSGKTTLVEAWMKHLEIEENKNTGKSAWKTISVDAYQNDFNDDPLLAIGEGILSLKGDEKKLKDLKKTFLLVWKWARPITQPIIANVVPLGVLVNKLLDGLLCCFQSRKKRKKGKLTSEVLDEFLEERLQTNETFADRIQKFRKDLESLAKDGKIIIFIDELYRCRPTYAIEMLEKVKHIFSVNGVVFVLVANGEQLCASLKKMYGQDFNAKEYLQKNISIHLLMPEIKDYQRQSWVDEFYKTMQKHLGEASISGHMESFFAMERPCIPYFTINNHKEIINSLSAARKLSYRQMQKLHIESFLAWKADLQHPFCPILIYLRSLDNGLYEEIKSESIRKDSFLKRIGINIAGIYGTPLSFSIFALARIIDPDRTKYSSRDQKQPNYWDHAVKPGEILSDWTSWDDNKLGEVQRRCGPLIVLFEKIKFCSTRYDSISQLCDDLDKFQISVSTKNTS